MESYKIIVKGKVQGVGFRYFVQTQAMKFKILGTVANSDDGSVIIYAQGLTPSINAFIETIKIGNRFSNVTDCSIIPTDLNDSFKKFRMIY